ncbi:MAG: outer membrane protein assembly factor BamD [Alkalispirochaeta sp.]
MKRFLQPTIISVFLGALLLLASCQSTPEEIPEGLSKAQMFQRAQEEVDRRNYEQALRYYDEFIRRNPDDPGSIIEAEYEIAYIAYKQDDYDTAEVLFEELLEQYDGENADELPEWPQVLAAKLLDRIEEERALLLGDIGDPDDGSAPPATEE